MNGLWLVFVGLVGMCPALWTVHPTLAVIPCLAMVVVGLMLDGGDQ